MRAAWSRSVGQNRQRGHSSLRVLARGACANTYLAVKTRAGELVAASDAVAALLGRLEARQRLLRRNGTRRAMRRLPRRILSTQRVVVMIPAEDVLAPEAEVKRAVEKRELTNQRLALEPCEIHRLATATHLLLLLCHHAAAATAAVAAHGHRTAAGTVSTHGTTTTTHVIPTAHASSCGL